MSYAPAILQKLGWSMLALYTGSEHSILRRIFRSCLSIVDLD